ncbi:MAG: hypothetical protein PVS2B1_17080 [Candidatus Dormibacteraceae bacterium]
MPITWRVAERPWAVKWRELSAAEKKLLDDTIAKLAIALDAELCACGMLADPWLPGGDRCKSCWGKR